MTIGTSVQSGGEVFTRRGSGGIPVAALLVAWLALTGCSKGDTTVADHHADELVAATRAAGVAPNLTPEVAAALYGDDAPAVCAAFDGGLSTPAANVLLGNPGHGRRKTITVEAVVYARLVIGVYCPDVADDFAAAVRDLDPFETNT